jgi:sugar O-acyltransferase (sialic acid O-acetyltransferase NeuD family)
VILGASGNALDVLDVVDAINARAVTWNVLGLLDDSHPSQSRFGGLPVIGEVVDASSMEAVWFFNAIGSDRSFHQRPRLVSATGLPAQRFATLIHPLAAVSSRARFGHGVCVNPGACVAGNVAIGDHVWLGPGCIVGHDTVIEGHAMLAPGAVVSGACRLEPACYVGAGAIIRQRVRIGQRALIGMGAIVLRDVEAGTTMIGNPARPLARRGGQSVRDARTNGIA